MTAVAPPKKTAKRDALIDIEARMQGYWELERVFEVDAPPADSPDRSQPKYMVSFPFPYMNGRLHLGHSFSLSKCEFAAGYERLKGKRVLFPFGFHCTGMPIKACADKLRREIELYGNPPVFPSDGSADVEVEEVEEANGGHAPATATATSTIKKKGKVVAKSTGKKYQWQIMESMGVDPAEIANFADPRYWLVYFPPRAQADLKRLGVKVDWRRSFITTDVNPYFDSFVRWQFRRLKAADKIKFGKRYTIYSPLDAQPCMDHDRQTGEGVAPQEYTLIKLELQRPYPPCLQSLNGADGLKVYLTAATLRPETMYGQTNCFVGPALQYGAYRVSDTEVFVCTERSALNLAYQGYTAPGKQLGQTDKMAEITGRELVGCKVKAPLSAYPAVYVLPMDSVLATKGTGVVTSVPSDSPDDYATLMDLKKKTAYYQIQDEWVQPFDPLPIIDTPTYGNMAAVTVCHEMKINSPKDRKQLDLAKEKVYKEGFYSGTLIVGDFAGTSVQDAKPLIRQQMIASGQACPYWEPEGLVMSRSGDECVVCLTDQWYLNYGEESWKADAFRALDRMKLYHDEVRNSFVKCLEWLREWACSRSFGLGSRLPWDDQWLIESLSDSTIYMAYYTVSHFLQSSLDGSVAGLAHIDAKHLTDQVWDFIFTETAPMPSDSPIAPETLKRVRDEFTYFYPLDLRVSGKDLVNNHLTFFIYNHIALFGEDKWPLGIRANGHLLINSEKMSKSTGNFLTLSESIDQFSADGTRFALAEAGDGVEDANFESDIANSAILRLFTLKEWMEETMADAKAGKLRQDSADTFNDLAFLNDINNLIRLADGAYAGMLYYEAVKYAFHELVNAKDRYVFVCSTTAVPMKRAVVERYIRVQALMMAPIVPHFSEYVWRDVLGNNDSVMRALWPAVESEDRAVLEAKNYVDRVRREAGLGLINETQPKKKKSGSKPATPADNSTPPAPKTMHVYIASEFPPWQSAAITLLRSVYDATTGSFPDFKVINQLVAKDADMKPHMKQKKLMPFMREIMDAVLARGPAAFDRTLQFSERQVLETNAELLRLCLGMEKIVIKDAAQAIDSEAATATDKLKRVADLAEPGVPSFYFAAE